MEVRVESEEQRDRDPHTGKRRRPDGPSVSSSATVVDQTGRELMARQAEWLARLVNDPASFAAIEREVHEHARRQADLYVAGLLAQASAAPETARHVDQVLASAEVPLRPVEKKRRPVMVRLLGGLALTVMALYAAPRRRSGMGRGVEGTGLSPELAAYRISEGCSPNVQAEVGRLIGQLPIAAARTELARRGLNLDEKAVRRIASELGTQMLAVRTRALLRFRVGGLPAGTEFAGKRIAVPIDGGRVRVRTIVTKSRVGGQRQRRKFRIAWREPKVVIVYELDRHGRMARGSRPVIDGTLQGPGALIELVAFPLHRLGAAQAREVVFVADGAPWIWARWDWVVAQVGLNPLRVVEVLDWCHGVHHVSVALEALKFDQATRLAQYQRLRTLLKKGKVQALLRELEALAEGSPADSAVWREIRYLRKHAEARRLRYDVFRSWRLPLGSGAIESTIRRVINLRLKGSSLYWTEENAEAVFPLRAAGVSGRWDETVEHTQEAVARDRRKAWRWTPPDCLAELKALEAEDDEMSQVSTAKRAKRTAA